MLLRPVLPRRSRQRSCTERRLWFCDLQHCGEGTIKRAPLPCLSLDEESLYRTVVHGLDVGELYLQYILRVFEECGLCRIEGDWVGEHLFDDGGDGVRPGGEVGDAKQVEVALGPAGGGDYEFAVCGLGVGG